jgi:hypothetical protein
MLISALPPAMSPNQQKPTAAVRYLHETSSSSVVWIIVEQFMRDILACRKPSRHNMARFSQITNHWFVSVETPKHMRFSRHARETKSFPTEIEAKRFATAMLSEGRKVTAGTLNPHQPIRRTVTASEIYQWIKEREKRARAPNC